MTLLLISAACQAVEPQTPEFTQPSYQECFIELQKSLKVEQVGLKLEAENPALYQKGNHNDHNYTTQIKVNGLYPEPEIWIEKPSNKNNNAQTETNTEKTRRICKTIYGLHF